MDLYERVIASLHDAALGEADWTEASALIDEACRSEGNILMYGGPRSQSPATAPVTRFCYRGTRRGDWERLYLGEYYPTDIIPPRVTGLQRGTLTGLQSLYTRSELKTSRTYNELHSTCHSQHSVLALLSGPDHSLIFWANANPVGAKSWDYAQTETIRRLLPHVRQYVHVRQALVDAQALGASLTALLDNSRLGVIQLDRNGRIVETNGRALDLLRSGEAIYDKDGFLRAMRPDDDGDLQALLTRSLPTFANQASGGSMLLKHEAAAAQHVLHLVPIKQRQPDFPVRRVAALVLVVSANSRPNVDEHLVAAALGLTPTQTEVAVLLAKGHPPGEIASRTGSGIGTVRWHIKQIFARTGVSRQAELVHLVLTMGNVPASG